MTDYFVRPGGNDGNSGLVDSDAGAFLTVGYGLSQTTGDDNLYVRSGFYFDEVWVSGSAAAGKTVNVIGDSKLTVVLRINEVNAFNYVFRVNDTGNNVFQNITFQQDVFGDGSANTLKYFFLNGVAQTNLKFINCEAYGSNRFIVNSATNTGTLEYIQCYLHDFTNYPHYWRGQTLISAQSCLIRNAGAFYSGFNHAVGAFSVKNCTFINTSVGDFGTGTTASVTLQNNIFYGAGFFVNFDSVSSFVEEGNLIFNSAMPSPRTRLGYLRINIDHADYVQNVFCFDPDFADETTGELNSTSFCIGRGVNAGVTYALDGTAFDNTNKPMIGCWTGGTKQTITKTAKKAIITGDSLAWGQGPTAQADRFYDKLKALLPTFTFVDMPNEADRPVAISGIGVETIHMMAQEFAVSEMPETVAIEGGVNNLSSGESTASVINQIKASLDRLNDIGIDNIVYYGTGVKSADAAAPDVTDTNTVETAVAAHCTSNSFAFSKVSYEIQQVSGWNSDSIPPGLYNADNLHWGNLGATKVAELVGPLMTYEPPGEGGILGGSLLGGDLITSDNIVGGDLIDNV